MKPIAGTLMFFIAMTTQAKQGAIVIHAGAGSINREHLPPSANGCTM